MGGLFSWLFWNGKDKEEKVVLVTGAGSGLGAALARFLVENGDTVLLADVNAKAIEDLASELNLIVKQKGMKNKAYPLAMNVASDESVKNAVNEAIRLLSQDKDSASTQLTIHDGSSVGIIDAIVNFAGLLRGGPLIEMPMQDLIDSFNVNVIGMCRVNQAFYPLLRHSNISNARIINVASEVSYYQIWAAFNAPYAMTKIAVEAYSSCLRQELMTLPGKKPYVIVVNPGAMKTPMTEVTLQGGPGSFEFMAKKNPNSPFANAMLKGNKPAMDYIRRHLKDPVMLSRAVFNAIHQIYPKRHYVVNASLEFVIASLLPRWLFEWITVLQTR